MQQNKALWCIVNMSQCIKSTPKHKKCILRDIRFDQRIYNQPTVFSASSGRPKLARKLCRLASATRSHAWTRARHTCSNRTRSTQSRPPRPIALLGLSTTLLTTKLPAMSLPVCCGRRGFPFRELIKRNTGSP